MSVNTWERELSNTQYLYATYKLNERLSNVIKNTSKKYKSSYADFVIKAGLTTFETLFNANKIMINEYTPDADFKERKRLLRLGISQLNITAATMNIFLKHVREVDGVNQVKIDKLLEDISLDVSAIESMIYNVIKSDEKRQADIKAARKAARE